MNGKNLIQRTLTGIAFITTLLASIYFQKEYYSFSALMLIITGIGLFEFYRIANKDKHVNIPSTALIVGGILLYISMSCYHILDNSDILIFAYITYFIIVIIAELYRNKKYPTHNLAFSFLGQVMVAFPFGLLGMMASQFEWYWFIALFLLIWTCDTGAYVVGVSIGKHKLFERISPKKSWEGFFGGLLFALIGGGIFAYLFPEHETWEWLLFALLITISGTYGDLSESLLKRTAHVKDSGTLLPGHGGVLDRFDSIMLASPVIYIYLTLIEIL